MSKKIKQSNIIILGAGLSGLTTAYILHKQGIKATLLEARNRIGGRIHTLNKENNAPLELGATWLGKKHLHLNNLLVELGIDIFPQELGKKAIYEPISTSPPQLVHLPPNEDPSYRIANGSSQLIDALASNLDEGQIKLNENVLALNKSKNGFNISTNNNNYFADIIISTIPPNLLVKSISFSPTLPSDILDLCQQTHTWMGESIKICLTYAKPFWRKSSSATVFSNVGPISELYDHSDITNNKFALKGFMNGGLHGATEEERKKFTLNQLSKYFGKDALNPTSYNDCAWKNEKFTFCNYDGYVLPHQNNGHEKYQSTHFDDNFFISGSETAPSFPGYMDGAVESANIVAKRVINDIFSHKAELNEN